MSDSQVAGRQGSCAADRLSIVWIGERSASYARDVSSGLLLAFRRWQSDEAGTLAAAVAYYLALSLFPMLLLLISGIGLVMRYTTMGHDAEVHLLELVAEHCSPSLEAQVRNVMLQLRDQAIVGCPFGLTAAVFAAIGVFHQFERSFDRIWHVPNASEESWRTSLRLVMTKRVTAFLLFGCVGAMLMLILAANVALGAAREWMTSLHIPGTVLVTIVDATGTIALNAMAFGILFRWLPKRPVGWREAWRGGLLVALIWEAGRQVLGAFLIGMRYTTAYGVIGSFIALLLWFYWGVNILFFGAEYVRVLSIRRAERLGRSESDAEDQLRDAFAVRVLKFPSEKLRRMRPAARRAA